MCIREQIFPILKASLFEHFQVSKSLALVLVGAQRSKEPNSRCCDHKARRSEFEADSRKQMSDFRC